METTPELSNTLTFGGQQASAVLVLRQAIRMASQLPISPASSQELRLCDLYHTRSYAILLTSGAFTASIRIQEDESDVLTWYTQVSSGSWKTLAGDLLVTPMLKLSRGSEEFQLPWSASPFLTPEVSF